MPKRPWKRAEDLQAGEYINIEPLIRKYDPENEGGIIVAEFEYACIENIRNEDVGPDYPTLIYTNIANLAVSRDEIVELMED